MHLGYAILHERRVPIIVEQPGLDAGDVLGQPFAVGLGCEPCAARASFSTVVSRP